MLCVELRVKLSVEPFLKLVFIVPAWPLLCPLLSVWDSPELELGNCESPDGGAGDQYRSC